MSFELREHTADVGVAATGATIGGAFAAVADGLAAAQCDDVPEDGDRFDVTVRSESPEALLFDYLDELIYRRDVRSVLPVDNAATVERNPAEGSPADSESDGATDAEWLLTGSARGVPLDRIRAREVKAVTYSEMRIAETADGWDVYVVFDV
jgi:SHS2 domain-containing protein